MLVPNLLFDLILFGTLLVASVLDYFFPALDGAALLFAVGAATYIAAQELSDVLSHAKWWTQESLSTSLALSTGGFIYYWWRNQSDLTLLCLSIGLMMASLMVAISVIACCSSIIKDISLKPLGGLLLTTLGSLALGLFAGLVTLNASIYITLIVIVSLALWKLRENIKPPARNAMAQQPAGPITDTPSYTTFSAPPTGLTGESRAADSSLSMRPLAHPSGRWMLVPERGTLLDRFLPVLVLGALACMMFKEAGPSLQWPASPASAYSTNSSTNQNP